MCGCGSGGLARKSAAMSPTRSSHRRYRYSQESVGRIPNKLQRVFATVLAVIYDVIARSFWSRHSEVSTRRRHLRRHAAQVSNLLINNENRFLILKQRP